MKTMLTVVFATETISLCFLVAIRAYFSLKTVGSVVLGTNTFELRCGDILHAKDNTHTLWGHFLKLDQG